MDDVQSIMQNLVELFARVWNETFAGISVGQLAVTAVVLLVFLLLRRFFARFIIARLKALASKTKTEVDDHILAALQQPLMFLFLILGLSFVIQWIPFNPSLERVLVQILQSFVAFTIFWTIFRILEPVSVFFDTF
ncbi:uncharacterized protein METZ01_LOCUS182691, partial [marine metagenome]